MRLVLVASAAVALLACSCEHEVFVPPPTPVARRAASPAQQELPDPDATPPPRRPRRSADSARWKEPTPRSDLLRGTVGAGALGTVKLKNLGPPFDPPDVAAAVEHRQLEPQVALSMLREVWLRAVKRRDFTLAAYALDRSADVLMDLDAQVTGEEARLTQLEADAGVAPRVEGCSLAHDDYVRAYALAELAGDRRLLGRIAHDIGWALERCDGPHGEIVSWYEVALAHRLAARDAGGVRFTANNLGRVLAIPKWRRLELYLLAAEGARVAQDFGGTRKIEGNIARLWFYSVNAAWVSPEAGASGGRDDYDVAPLAGEVRRQFLLHLGKALEAGRKADESSRTVCRGILLESGPDCEMWGDLPPAELFPEGCCWPEE